MSKRHLSETELRKQRKARRLAIYKKRKREVFKAKLKLFIIFIAAVFLIKVKLLSSPGGSEKENTAKQTDSVSDKPYDQSNIEEESQHIKTPDYEKDLEAAIDNYRYSDGLDPDYEIKGSAELSEDAKHFFRGYSPVRTESTVTLPLEMSKNTAAGNDTLRQGSSNISEESEAGSNDVFLDSESAVLIDLDEGTVLVERNADVAVYPASMTKVLTMLVAEEQISDRSGTFTITRDITDLTFSESLSAVSWDVGETVTLADLEYGTILPSGADAAIGMARYSVGSEDKLVELMNKRVKAMGLSEHTKFTNVTGMYDDNQTVALIDMAMIMKAAVSNKRLLEVMRTGEYTTSATKEHPKGVYFFNLFLDRTQNIEMPGTVVAAKTGYTVEALNCAVSYYVSESGKHYVCATARGHGSRRVVTDHVNLYKEYAK